MGLRHHELERQRRSVHRLAPPTGVARATDPGAPEVDGVLERPGHVVGRTRRARHPRLGFLQHERRGLPGGQVERGDRRAVTGDGHRDVGPQPNGGPVGTARREQHLAVAHLHLVLGARVVEPRLEGHVVAQGPAHCLHTAHELPRVIVRIDADRHEVGDLTDTGRRQEPGDQDVRVGEVQLLAGEIVVETGVDAEPTTTRRRRAARRRSWASRTSGTTGSRSTRSSPRARPCADPR